MPTSSRPLLWVDNTLHQLRKPGMIRFLCKYQQLPWFHHDFMSWCEMESIHPQYFGQFFFRKPKDAVTLNAIEIPSGETRRLAPAFCLQNLRFGCVNRTMRAPGYMPTCPWSPTKRAQREIEAGSFEEGPTSPRSTNICVSFLFSVLHFYQSSNHIFCCTASSLPFNSTSWFLLLELRVSHEHHMELLKAPKPTCRGEECCNFLLGK